MAQDRAFRQFRQLSRRDWLRLSSASVLAGSASGWFDALAAHAAADPSRQRACILLWMPGGPSQLDTFDPKPDHDNGGPFAAIDTTATDVRISEHLPELAKRMHHLALLRSMTSKEGDHGRATYFVRTGYPQQGAIQYPSIGPLLAKELARRNAELPNCISIARNNSFVPTAFGSGFLGPQFAPLYVGRQAVDGGTADPLAAQLQVPALQTPPGVSAADMQSRRALLSMMEDHFAAGRPTFIQQSRQAAYEQAYRMMSPDTKVAFDLTREPDALRDRYGRNFFGQSCLLARRLVERGVPFVEVSLEGNEQLGGIGWDTHNDNFNIVKSLSEQLDAAWSALIDDLHNRGLLESTTIAWMGEFGRTPQINAGQGRDHFPAAWSTVLCGGGIRGGQAIGRTSHDGTAVEDRPITVPDLLATLLKALGIDPAEQNMSNLSRPIRLVDSVGQPIEECLL